MDVRIKRARGRADARRGVAMVMVLLVMVGLTALTLAVSGMGLGIDKKVGGRIDDRRAFHLAESGLAEAMTALRAGTPYTGGVATQAQPAVMGDGLVWVTATPNPADLNEVRLDSVALAGSGRASVAAIIDVDKPPLFPNTINSKEVLTMNADVVVDSYDSQLGTYASQVVNTFTEPTTLITYNYANDNGTVASDNDIILNAHAVVFGDATPGPGHTVQAVANGSYVSGSVAAASTVFGFPQILPPTLPGTTAYSVPTNGSQTITGNQAYDTLTINKSATLKVVGPAEIVLNDFTGGKDGQLIIDATAGPVTFFVAGTYTHINGFEALPAPGSPMAVAFLIDGSSPITFPASTNIRGAYYAPNADITFANSSEAWGSFAANRVSMANAMKFHYDETLAQHWDVPNSQNDGLHVRYWTTAEVPKALRLDRNDPFALLGVKKANLLSPAQSWQTVAGPPTSP